MSSSSVNESSALERLFRRDRWIVSGGLTAVVLVAAVYTVFGVGMNMSALDMTVMSGIEGMSKSMGKSMMMPARWTPHYFVLVFLMWWIMMIAMMIPSASPTILLYAALHRRFEDSRDVLRKAAFFTLGYLAAWTFFSLLATFLQWSLEIRALASPMSMTVTSNLLGPAILLAAGVYQFAPVKQACLRHCRDPIRFLTQRRRVGGRGALVMGVEHGIFCLGCCWFLMALLFFGGVMNLYWISGLAIFVLFEKLIPQGHWIGLAGGVALIGAGGTLLVQAIWPGA